MLNLTVIEAEQFKGEKSKSLKHGILTIGRGADCDWVLPDPKRRLSRDHCTIEWKNGRYVLTDTSKHGVFINGDSNPVGRNNSVILTDGDHIKLGSYLLQVSIDTTADDVDLLAERPDRKESGTPVDPFAPVPFDDDPTSLSPDDLRTSSPKTNDGASSLSPTEIINRDFPPDAVSDNKPIASDSQLSELYHPRPQRRHHRAKGSIATSLDTKEAEQERSGTHALIEGSALQAFCQGAGVDPAEFAADDASALLFEFGSNYAAMIRGLRQLLAARDELKKEADLKRTRAGASGNNPLKFVANDKDAILSLMMRQKPGFLEPNAAIEASIADLQIHDLALLDGLQAALQALLDSLEPKSLERELHQVGGLSGLFEVGKKAQYWELYKERYSAISKQLQRQFMGDFDREFADAYERRSKTR